MSRRALPPLSPDAIRSVDVAYAAPVRPRWAGRVSVAAMEDAWRHHSEVDFRGHVWVSVDVLHVVLRTRPPQAAAFFETVDHRCRLHVGAATYVSASVVWSEIDRRLLASWDPSKNALLRYSAAHYVSIRDAAETDRVRGEYLRSVDVDRRLKQRRIALLGLTTCELTGAPLVDRAEFSHVLARSVYQGVRDFVWSGLVVNPDVQVEITRAGVLHHRQLLELCVARGWKTDWVQRLRAQALDDGFDVDTLKPFASESAAPPYERMSA